jgi:hypothetical protein
MLAKQQAVAMIAARESIVAGWVCAAAVFATHALLCVGEWLLGWLLTAHAVYASRGGGWVGGGWVGLLSSAY